MPVIVETTVFTFAELADAARAKARDWYREGSLHDEWWDCVFDDFSAICEILGIELKTRPVPLMDSGAGQEPCIWFRGFCSQGDGANFEVILYSYAKGSVEKIKAYAPQDTELHSIGQCLAAIQRKNFYQLYARVDQRGHYCHGNTMQIDVRRDEAEMTNDAEEVIAEAMRDLARWLYRRLEAEHDHLNSDDVVEDSITANGYAFTAEGRRFG